MKGTLNVMCSSQKTEWETPNSLFEELDKEFNFTLDPCCTHNNAKCEKHYTKEDNGLLQDWTGERVFCNPPYGKELPPWIRKCAEHGERGGLAVMLIFARTDTKAFHEYIYHKAEIRFLKGRVKFGGCKNAAPFPSMIVIFGNH